MKAILRTLVAVTVALAVVNLPSPFALYAADKKSTQSTSSLPRTGQISTFDQSGKPVAYQRSGQDGEFQRGVVWPDPRFVANQDGTILDNLTGLMWTKEGNCFGKQQWPNALTTVEAFNKGEMRCQGLKNKYPDWFLPNVEQLTSLVDAQADSQSEQLKVAGFSSIQDDVYWSSTPYVGRLNAWAIDFSTGQIKPTNKLEGHYLILARFASPGKLAGGKEGPAPSIEQQRSDPSPSILPQRFTTNGDDTVTDTQTGLMWLKDGGCLSALDWQGALLVGQRLAADEKPSRCPTSAKLYSDWSLPNMAELRSLIDYEFDYPALPKQHPLNDLDAAYWTGTTVARSPDQAFTVDFDTGALLASPKTEKHKILLVRPSLVDKERPRKEVAQAVSQDIQSQHIIGSKSTMAKKIHWPPEARFFDNGDGTSMDARTGIIWLTDANCFGKQSWLDIPTVLIKFNSTKLRTRGSSFKCEGYDGGFDDWVMPTLQELRELTIDVLANKEEKDNEAWSRQQGVKKVQTGGIYWTANETPINLYFADGISLKTGKTGIYPKTLKFFIWPKRKTVQEGEQAVPLLSLTGNAIDGVITLSPKDPLTLVCSLHTFGLRTPADFWFWYDTPDEKRLWLSPMRTWTDKPTPVYQGALFNLKNYEIFHTDSNGLAPGVYSYHFAVDTIPNGIMDGGLYESLLSVVIPDEKK